MSSSLRLADSIVIRRGPGRPLVVRVVRRDQRRRRRVAARMCAAGRSVAWIARALRVSSERIGAWLGRAA